MSSFSKWCLEHQLSTCRRLKLDQYLSPCAKLMSKWFKNLNIKTETLQMLKSKICKCLKVIVIGKHFLNRFLFFVHKIIVHLTSNDNYNSIHMWGTVGAMPLTIHFWHLWLSDKLVLSRNTKLKHTKWHSKKTYNWYND